jgi:hypothetical protein
MSNVVLFDPQAKRRCLKPAQDYFVRPWRPGDTGSFFPESPGPIWVTAVYRDGRRASYCFTRDDNGDPICDVEHAIRSVYEAIEDGRG